MNSGKLPRKKNYSSMRMLGAQLQAARKAAGYTQRSLAGRLNVDEETIASIEQGRRVLMPDLAVLIDDLLDTKGMLAAGVAKLPEVDQLPLNAEQYMQHEHDALSLSWFDALVMPGILQTEAYARAVFRCRVPAFSAEKLEEMIAERLNRQEIIHRPDPPTLSFVIWEPVIRFPVGGPEAHREQIERLRDSADIPHVSLQILPLKRDGHAGIGGFFTLMETPDHQQLAYTESYGGSELVRDPEWVSFLARKYAMLRSQALTPEFSASLLDDLLGEL
ncbi:helix-turn-helix transcriptional regulator [Streptomyces sp. J2-1]|uniref:helix-turn-helix domain-containing protein n=1 Tax=Streptomyces corallincola TaxID=2851888 RepID=UPI001C385E3F|nr:helix-turn-helix transcriptional regulator [Streptomyces corallincola]MBV2354972.1 helix-turn-helix transcriptional regulator [Streptomyces corallincola]